MGRFQAAHFFGWFVLLCSFGLTGCSSTGSPLGSTVRAFMPGGHGDVTEQARHIPYASIDFSMGRRGGLLVLAEEKKGLTFWQTGRDEVIVLGHGDLQAMAGLLPRLEMNELSTADGHPIELAELGRKAHFEVLRAWRDGDNVRHSAAAQAHWSCAVAPAEVKLPLTTRRLHKCVASLEWAGGKQTRSIYWRDAGGHIWKADVAAWPGAPGISWRVARPWWPL
jgi:hypothetical protein